MVLRFGFYSGDIFFLSFISSCMIQYSYLIMFVYWVSLCACECPFSFHSLDSSLSLYIQVIGVEYPVRSVDVLYDFVMILQSTLHVTPNLFSYHQSWHTFAMTIYCLLFLAICMMSRMSMMVVITIHPIPRPKRWYKEYKKRRKMSMWLAAKRGGVAPVGHPPRIPVLSD